jgi:hypothetical protein
MRCRWQSNAARAKQNAKTFKHRGPQKVSPQRCSFVNSFRYRRNLSDFARCAARNYQTHNGLSKALARGCTFCTLAQNA